MRTAEKVTTWACGATAALVLVCAVCASAKATTWIVDADPLHPEDRIGNAVGDASSGDTILVGPGVFYEHIPLVRKSIVLIGRDGPEVTILDGGRAIEGRQGAILYSLGPATGDLTVLGCSFRNGTGAYNPGLMKAGGAIAFWNTEHAYEHLTIRNCRFINNGMGDEEALGGAVAVGQEQRVEIGNCMFSGNVAQVGGGCLYLGDTVEGAFVTDCEFEVAPTGFNGGSAVQAAGGSSFVEISGNTFRYDSPRERGVLVVTRTLSTRFIRNVLIDQTNSVAGLLMVDPAEIGTPHSSVEMRGNAFLRSACATGFNRDVQIGGSDCACTVAGNTLAHCLILIGIGGGTPLLVENNIAFGCPVQISSGPGGVIRCNDVWPDSIQASGGHFALERNISADPQFCGIEGGNFGIRRGSPCAAENAPAGCGLIGAFDVACDSIVPVRRTSIGSVKRLFR